MGVPCRRGEGRSPIATSGLLTRNGRGAPGSGARQHSETGERMSAAPPTQASPGAPKNGTAGGGR
eukprot:4830137-Alexandrium_andersonii.AAC.1